LVVEDDFDTREALVMVFESADIEVVQAADAEEGFELFLRERPRLVVSDLWMGASSGFRLVERIRSLPAEEGGLTPAIAMTAGGDTMETTLMRGFQAHLPKPIDADAMIELSRSFLDAATAAPTSSGSCTVHLQWGAIVVTMIGDVRAGDARAAAAEVVRHLGQRTGRLVADLERMRSFEWSAPSVAQDALFGARHRIEHVTIVGGTKTARLVSRAVCAVLGVPFSEAARVDEATRRHPDP
jgi:CheY-like chemotaxis protein